MRTLSYLLSVTVCACLAGAAWAGPARDGADPNAALKIYGMDSKPVTFQSPRGADGFAVHLASAILAKLDQHDAIEIVPWARAISMVMRDPNVLLLGIARTPEREQRVSFIGPLFKSHVSAFVLKDRMAELNLPAPALRRLRAGARRGSMFAAYAAQQGFRLTDEVNSSAAAARMLVNRRFDLWFEREEIVPDALRDAGYAPDAALPTLRIDAQNVYLGFSAGTPSSVLLAWEKALRELKRDGSYVKLLHLWLPDCPPLMETRLYPAAGGRQ